MRVNVWFALNETIPELRRQETLEHLGVLLLAGQRGLKDSDFKDRIRKLEQPVRRAQKVVSDEEFEILQNKANRLNALVG